MRQETFQLTPSQQAAVLYLDGDSSIIAGAGSGKTRVLIEKTAILVEKYHVPLSKILLVTFTEKAAQEIKERLAKRLRLPDDILDTLSIGTLHAFAANCVRAEAQILGLDPEFQILDDPLAKLERLRTVHAGVAELLETRDPEILDSVEKFGFQKTIKIFLQLLAEPRDPSEPLQVPNPQAFKFLRQKYADRKKALNRLDFNDLEELLLTLLNQPTSLAKLQNSFSWLIVDEFQDTNPIQWKVLSKLHGAGTNKLVIVGDPRQSIYRFRRADPALFQKVSDGIQAQGGKIFYLSENFRSAPEIIDFINDRTRPLFGQYPDLISKTQKQGSVDFVSFPAGKSADERRLEEAKSVVSHLVALHQEQGVPWKSMTLLFRTRKPVPLYEEVLKSRDVPYKTNIGEPLLERPEILALFYFMKKQASADEKPAPLAETALSYSHLSTLTQKWDINPLPDFLKNIFEAVRPLFPEDVHPNLDAFEKLTGNLSSLGVNTLKSLLETLSLLRDNDASITCPPTIESRNAIQILTIHASKGLEFPVVALGDLAAKALNPSRLYLEGSQGFVMKEKDSTTQGLKDQFTKNEAFEALEKQEKDEDTEESKRLLYVALTRAIERLILPMPQSAEVDKKGKEKTWPGWIGWLKTT